MLPDSAILENCGRSACNDMKLLEYIFQVGNYSTR